MFVVGSSRDVLHAAHRQAGARGFVAECEMSCDDAPLASAAECLFASLERMQRENPGKPVCVISGGGSALVESPLEKSVTLDDLIALNRVLVGCGASIDEINSIRKHLSAVKGGRLAEAAAKAHQVTLLLSDVPERNPATIASGPTLPDPTTIEMCTVVAERYNLLGKFPPAIRELF